MIKKIKILAVSALLAAFAAQTGAYAAVAPVNPDFVEYMERSERPAAARSAASNAAKHMRGGYVPSPIDWSHLDGKTWSVRLGEAEGAGARSAANAELPAYYLSGEDTAQAPAASFNLRADMPAVRDQTGFNTCWIHSAMAATESNLILKGLADTSIDLSEWYLTYYSYLPCGDMPGFTNASDEAFYMPGGNDWRSVALLSRGTGSVSAAKVPDISTYNFATGTYDDYSAVYEPPVTARNWKLQNALYLGDAGGFEIQLTEARRDMIKRAIMEHGAVSVGYYADDSPEAYNAGNASYYSGLTYGSTVGGYRIGTNHAVAIVGWDDAYPKDNFTNKPEHDGAWIVRNSWGDGWGDGGYFYMSYDEGTLCDGVAYDTVAALNGERIYQYDPLGLVNWYTPDESSLVLYFANVFTAEGDDSISSVAFYVPDGSISYEVSVYTGCGGSPVSGTLAAEKSVGTLIPGYNTVELDAPVEVGTGTRFSVVVKAQSPAGGFIYMAPAEYCQANYSESASANPGEGWVSTDGENFTDVLQASAQDGIEELSLCIKAFGERIYTASDTPAPVSGAVTVSGGNAAASASKVSDDDNEKAQSGVQEALAAESVAGVAPDKNVALLGAFRMNVEHNGGAAQFTVELSEPMRFEGTPYVIIENKKDYAFHAFRAEYDGSAPSLTFSVDRLEDYFSEATVVIADVKDSVSQPAAPGSSSGGCSAGLGALALLAAVPLAALRTARRRG